MQKILRTIALKRLPSILGLPREDTDAILKPPLGAIKRKNSDSGDGGMSYFVHSSMLLELWPALPRQ